MTLAPGTQVTDNVMLVEPLGEGGMGSVWVAHHDGLRTRVAVKFIAADLLEANPDIVKRFSREATAAAQIKSAHVVQTLDHGLMDDGTPYIVMELLEGESMAERLIRDTTMPLGQVSQLLDQVAKGLGKAHAAGIIHRDIKPDNIFLLASEDDDLYVKLLDFGVAKHTQAQSVTVVTSTGTMLGTPGYMSPEQVLTGKDVDLRSDLWSLAVVAYHAMIGDIPFQGETLGALCVAISRGAFTPPSELRSDVPKAVDEWMLRALSQDVDGRFQSAKELAATFRGALKGLSPNSADSVAMEATLNGEGQTLVMASPLRETAGAGQPTQSPHELPAQSPQGAAPEVTLQSPDAPRTTLEPATRVSPRSASPLLIVGIIAGLSFVVGFGAVLIATTGIDDGAATAESATPAASAETEPPADQTSDDERQPPASETAAEADGADGVAAETEPSATATAKAASKPPPRARRPLKSGAPPKAPPAPLPRSKDRGF